MNAGRDIRADCLVPGAAQGEVTLLQAPLSLWGGFDLASGTVADVNHPDFGAAIAGRVLVMPGGRGSSSSSSVLLESARLGVNPLAIVLGERDPILAVGALVAADLYGVSIPVVRIARKGFERLGGAGAVRIDAQPGNVLVEPLSLE